MLGVRCWMFDVPEGAWSGDANVAGTNPLTPALSPFGRGEGVGRLVKTRSPVIPS
jgi:hypothetical protein